ncbi:MAG: hypothetical protein VYB38_05875, partial [Bacteroidota bacterium]|nr:hypothetical protein [Bacteroidota bacterium]
MRHLVLILCFGIAATGIAQDFQFSDSRVKHLAVRDTMLIDSVSINPVEFAVYTLLGMQLDSTAYAIDYGRALFSLNAQAPKVDSLKFKYRVFPDFLT